ncbi:MAG: hypothetical protein LPK03_01480 [Pontibacter sp.]|nr:hypothetical protein [Pontibacter sp.]
MHRIIYLIAATLLFTINSAAAQSRFSVAPRIGYGSISMAGMKTLQQEMVRGSELNARATDTFPAYYQFGLALSYKASDIYTVGAILEKGSTGGRVAYADYSGSYQIDQLIKYNAVGAFIEHEFNSGKPVTFIGLETAAMASTLSLESTYTLYDATATSEDKLEAFGVGFKPYVGVQYPLGRIQPRLSAGYFIYTGKPFHLPDNKEMVLMVNNNETGPDWSGFRLNFSVGLLLF